MKTITREERRGEERQGEDHNQRGEERRDRVKTIGNS